MISSLFQGQFVLAKISPSALFQTKRKGFHSVSQALNRILLAVNACKGEMSLLSLRIDLILSLSCLAQKCSDESSLNQTVISHASSISLIIGACRPSCSYDY